MIVNNIKIKIIKYKVFFFSYCFFLCGGFICKFVRIKIFMNVIDYL